MAFYCVWAIVQYMLAKSYKTIVVYFTHFC